MSRTLAFVLCLFVLSGPIAVGADDVPLENLPGANFRPGQLRLPLHVMERSGVERRGALVTSGVPFPPGFLTDESKLAVVDDSGRAVLSQATCMVKWHRPVYDDSVQWALVSFLADVPAGDQTTYWLVDDPPSAVASPLRLVKDDGTITVETGPAQFVVPLEGDALIRSASIDGRPVIGGQGLRPLITAGDWPDRELASGQLQVGHHDAEGVTIEESGPARIVIAIDGVFRPGDRDAKFYEFTARLYFEAHSPAVRVIYTIRNGRLDPTLMDDGWRYVYTWPIEDASLTADLTLGVPARVTTPAEGEIIASDRQLVVYQDSSGGERWKDLGGGNYESWLSRYTGGREVRGVSFRGYRVTESDRQVAEGNSHPGVIDVTGGSRGMTAALRNFRVEYPHALAAGGDRLRIGLFPGEFREPFHLNAGQRKSWDVRLTLHAEDPPDLKQSFAVQDALLLFRPEPAWMVRAAAAGAWPYGLALVEDDRRQQRPLRRDATALDGIQTGWDWYGWISSYNAGGGHWNEETVLAPWVLWGDGENFDDAEAKTLWSADLTAIHYDDPDLAVFWLMLMSWNDHENRLKRVAYPDWYNRDTWGLPDAGHMGMLMWPEYYFLTGDMRAREAIEHLGHRARAMLWKHNHDDRSDGTGPMRTAVNWCVKRDPDAEPDFRLATRYVGWPLFDLANHYRLTGDPQLLAECRTVARAFRNTARYSPIGLMVLQIEPQGGTRGVYAFQGPFEKYRDLSASQCYAHFQQGLMVTGLIEYYLMSRDVEALDTMVGFADLMAHHCILRDPSGRRQGWTYAFGDYWGPYTWEDCGDSRVSFHTSNFTVVEGIGWIAQFTGRDDYRQLLHDAVTTPGGGFNEAAALLAVHHPHTDQTPPAAVTDLKAQLVEGGAVRLTWTAPGDDGGEGRAARYQVKHSTARIVERVQGWPDRSPPLPATAEEWEVKATAFNASQRAFWAANNLPGTPPPQPAGTIATMLIDNLPAGRHYFAVKSWDSAHNMSALSNVVEVMK